MEEHDLELRLTESRARLRTLLVPDPETGHIEADVFPRSIAMRVLVAGLPLLATRYPLLQFLMRQAGSRLR